VHASYKTTPYGKPLSRDLSSLFTRQTKKGDGLQFNLSTTVTWGQNKVAVIERLKQESMYGLSAKKVAVYM